MLMNGCTASPPRIVCRFRLLVLFAAFLFLYPSAAAAEGEIRVGWFLVPGMQTYAASADTKRDGSDVPGVYGGYSHEYLERIAEFTGWKYRFVVDTFANCTEMLRRGEIDLMPDMARTPERAQLFAYPDSSCGSSGLSLVTLADNDRFGFNDFGKFNGMRIGAVANSNMVERIRLLAARKHFTPVLVPCPSAREVKRALREGRIDAMMVSNLSTFAGLKVLARTAPQEFFIVASKERSELAEKIDDAILTINYYDPEYNDVLAERYFPGDTAGRVSFTAEEKAYLAQRLASGRPVMVAYDPAWPPAEYRDPETGAMAGIMTGIFARLSAITGLQFSFVPDANYADKASYADSPAEVAATVSSDYEWADEHGLHLTQPVFTTPIFVMFHPDRENFDVIALQRGYHLEKTVLARCREEARRRNVHLTFQYFDTSEACINAVRNHRAGRAYINSYEVNYYSAKGLFEGLSLQGVPRFSEPTGIGVFHHADPLLFHVLSRALHSIPQADINDIILNNTTPQVRATLRDFLAEHPYWSAAAVALVAVLSMLTVFLYFSNRTKDRQRLLLEQASTAKTDFLSRMSHDIRTPMNGVIGMTQIALEQNNPPVTADCLEKIRVSSKFLLGLINDILDMTRVESGRVELHPEPYLMAGFDSYIDSVIRPLCTEKRQTFISETHPVPHAIPVLDILRFNQIVFNLLSNAVKYTPEGGTIRLAVYNELVPGHRERITITISDNGVGMSEAFQKVLFEPFTQEGRSDLSEKRGSGLGLAIVSRLVSIMDGTISVTSRQGEGTTFTLVLEPDYIEAEQATWKGHETVPDDTSALEGRHVLLCEDHPLNQTIAKAMLSARKMTVEVAENGQVGVDLFSHSSVGFYDFILMDIRMPVLDGYAATRAIRALNRPDAGSVPIIAMTADAFSDAVEKCFAAGMDGHVSKPVDRKCLFAEMLKVLRQRKPGDIAG